METAEGSQNPVTAITQEFEKEKETLHTRYSNYGGVEYAAQKFAIDQVLHPAFLREFGHLRSQAVRETIDYLAQNAPEALKSWVKDRKFWGGMEEDKMVRRFRVVAQRKMGPG